MRSLFAINGHPFHPMLVALPIGLFVWALVADIAYLATDKEKMWYDISFWTGIAAMLTALAAALPGFGDYFFMAWNSKARSIATLHMVLNLGTVGVYFIAMLLMLDDGAVSGGRLSTVVALHAIGVGMLTLSGWLGGEMVFRHHLAMIGDSRELEQAEYERHKAGVR
jgi:uncharacterized membrane protein